MKTINEFDDDKLSITRQEKTDPNKEIEVLPVWENVYKTFSANSVEGTKMC